MREAKVPCPTCGEPKTRRVTEERVVSSTGGEKGQKEERYDLIPGKPLEKVARLYGRGAKKYSESNWRRGYDWSLSFAALQRHIWQFWNGEDMDEEMGMEHVACAIFHALALLEFMEEHREFDDRPSTLRQREEASPEPQEQVGPAFGPGPWARPPEETASYPRPD